MGMENNVYLKENGGFLPSSCKKADTPQLQTNDF